MYDDDWPRYIIRMYLRDFKGFYENWYIQYNTESGNIRLICLFKYKDMFKGKKSAILVKELEEYENWLKMIESEDFTKLYELQQEKKDLENQVKDAENKIDDVMTTYDIGK